MAEVGINIPFLLLQILISCGALGALVFGVYGVVRLIRQVRSDE